MLNILAPRTNPVEPRHRDIHNASRPKSCSGIEEQTQTQSFSMGRRATRNWESMTVAPSTAQISSSTSLVPPQAEVATAVRASQPQTSIRPRSVSKSAPKRANSIASSKASAPSWSDYWKPQEHNVPHLTKTPWEAERYKRNSTWRRPEPDRSLPARVFQNLPREIYDCIVLQLEVLHLQHDQACQTCYLQDLHSLSLTSRAWDRAATMQLYSKVYVIGLEHNPPTHKTKLKAPSRLKLLRRTLRDRHPMARHVRELHLPDYQTMYQQASIECEEIVNLVASLVMACPSLERLVGFHIPFTQSFDRLSYALSTRPKLRERVWLLSEPDDGCSDGEDDEEVDGCYLAACDPTEQFLSLNSRNPLLSTLVLHRNSDDFAPKLNFRAIIGTLRQLHMLQHLSISGMPATSFTNLALNALPPGLRSLRLENLPGINDKGLQKFATSQLASSLQKLTLINLELSSLITLTSILSENINALQRFSIAQYRTPELHSRSSIPNFSCPSLEFIHFEFRSQSGPSIDPFSTETRKSVDFPFANPEPISCLATSLLAMNIKEGAFPALRRIRIPHDPQGLIQALCKPRATALLPSDTSLFTRRIHKNGSHGYAIKVESHQSPRSRDSSCTIPISPRADSAIDSPTLDLSQSTSDATLSKSRLTAQARILAARKAPFITVRVYGPEGELCIDTALGGYIGDIKSKIAYDLEQDASRWPGNRDQSGRPQPEWITGVEDLADQRTAAHGRTRERYWGDCGHRIGGRIGCHTVRVSELF